MDQDSWSQIGFSLKPIWSPHAFWPEQITGFQEDSWSDILALDMVKEQEKGP